VTLRAVLFDLGDTLVRLDPFPSDMEARLASRLRETCPVGAARCEEIATVLAHDITTATRTASLEAHRDEVRIAAHVAAVLAADGIAADVAIAETIADVYGEADVSRIHAVPGRAELLESLRGEGLRLAIVSNTNTRGAILTRMLQDFGLWELFDAVVYSSEVGVRKPHVEIYQAALGGLGVAPGEAVFVGDRLREDVLGPARAGITGVLTHEFYRDTHNGEPFAVLDRLEGIRDVIAALRRGNPSA
jgi:putative hydrolase of the HAD superfamily